MRSHQRIIIYTSPLKSGFVWCFGLWSRFSTTSGPLSNSLDHILYGCDKNPLKFCVIYFIWKSSRTDFGQSMQAGHDIATLRLLGRMTNGLFWWWFSRRSVAWSDGMACWDFLKTTAKDLRFAELQRNEKCFVLKNECGMHGFFSRNNLL